jgi:transcriptional regulator with GAF, ATPase, and Fis domain
MKRTLVLSLLLAPAIAFAQDPPDTLTFAGRTEMVKVYPDGKVKWLASKKEVARAMVKLIGELQAQKTALAKQQDELAGRLTTCEEALRGAVAKLPALTPAAEPVKAAPAPAASGSTPAIPAAAGAPEPVKTAK